MRCSRSSLAIFALALVITAPGAAPFANPAPAGSWVEAWYSPPFPPTVVLEHQTVRQIVRAQTGGERVRVRLTNELGLTPVSIGAAHIALSSPNGVVEPGSDHLLTFNGRPDPSIPVGHALLSDPVDMRVKAFADLAISIYYPGSLSPSGHLTQVRISPSGDHGAEVVWLRAALAGAPALASGLEIQAGAPRRVVVAFGDSITEGAGSTPGANLDWPQQLALRLARSLEGKDWVVINSGIGGNRLLHDGAGPKALDRFDRDALDLPGVSAVILLEGINDIRSAYGPDGDTGPLSANDVIGAYRQLIARAHSRGLKIYGGTIIPYEDSDHYHPQGEAVRDPHHTSRFIGEDQCGDNLHPNDAGYRAMSEAVDLRLFR